VEISLGRLGEVKVDHQIHAHNIDASSEKISTDETPCCTLSEIIKNSKAILIPGCVNLPITVFLVHF
jgi:hypothetical protein